MVLVKFSVAQQRLEAVRAVPAGATATATEVAAVSGVKAVRATVRRLDLPGQEQ
jgi:hypothetical protein